MKKYIFTSIALCCSVILFAQIPNPDFENWNTTNTLLPVGWQTMGVVSQTTPVTEGNFAIRLERGGSNVDTNPYDPGAIIHGEPQGGAFSGGIPFADRPDSLVANFKYNVMQGDSAWVLFMFKENGVFISQDLYYVTGNHTSSFIRKAFAVNYTSGLVPDSLIIMFTSTNPNGSFLGSYVIIDDVHFTNTVLTVPNGGFENWITYPNEEPVDWFTSNKSFLFNPILPITKTGDAYSGNYAIRIENNMPPNPEMMGYALAGPQTMNGPAPGFPVQIKDTIFTGYYKFYPQNNDTASIGVMMFEQGVKVGGGNFQNSSTVNTYTQFLTHIFYDQGYAGTPDSANIYLVAFKAGSFPQGNSVLYVDNLKFDPSAYVGINETKPDQPSISNYPNPCSNVTLINYSLPENCLLTIKLYDVIGNEVAGLFNGNQQSGNHSLRYDTSNLPDGIYHLVMKSDNFKQDKKLVVQK